MRARKAKPASPRRKAGSKSARKTKRKISFRLVVEAQELRVTYIPNYLDGEYAQGQFEFRSPHRPARRIVISETGYRCHFAPMAEIRAAKSPQNYARQIVLAYLNSNSASRSTLERRGQLSLF